MRVRTWVFLTVVLCALLFSIVPSAADSIPRMTVAMMVDGQPRDPESRTPIGVGVPVELVWTLPGAAADARWQDCYLSSPAPLTIDSISPTPSRFEQGAYFFPAATRQVSIRFRATAPHAVPAWATCQAAITDSIQVYALASWHSPTAIVQLPYSVR